jgi:hypothetical protein
VVLFAVLLAAWLLWHRRPFLAAPVIALILLIKPFYALFFAAFVGLHLIGQPADAARTLRSAVLAGLSAAGLVGLEVLRWDPKLRLETLHYFLHASDYLWFSLPPGDAPLMSKLTITPLQALITAGVPLSLAQGIALGLWVLLTGLTFWCLRGVRLGFPLVFAFSLVLVYWGRPVGYFWTYLEFVLFLAVWPALKRWERIAVLGGLVLHRLWIWIGLLGNTSGPRLLPSLGLDPALEIWVVPLAAWLLLVWAARSESALRWPATAGADFRPVAVGR